MKRLGIGLCLVLLLASCGERRDLAYESMTADPAKLSPEVREYMFASQRAWYQFSRATSFRSISNQPRGTQTIHIEAELMCPDRYHVRMTGAVDVERYLIGDKRYERRNSGPWTVSEAKPPIMETARCQSASNQPRRRPPDEADAVAMAPVYADMQVSKGPIREYHGIKCQEFTETGTTFKPFSRCFSLEPESYFIAENHRGYSTIYFDWNKPITITPPKL